VRRDSEHCLNLALRFRQVKLPERVSHYSLRSGRRNDRGPMGQSCLGVNSICEFGRGRPELTDIHDAAARAISTAVVMRVREAQSEGDVAPELDPKDAARFLSASFTGIRAAARGGAAARELRALGCLALRALQ
jgi:hypothetical protein